MKPNYSVCVIFLFFFVKYSYGNVSCTDSSTCNKGFCSSNVCVCNTGYLDQGTSACSYKQKDKLTAFLLSLFIGFFGADWFYLASGNGAYVFGGLMKLFVGFFFIFAILFFCWSIIFASLSKLVDNPIMAKFGFTFGIIISILCLICISASIIWYFIDWIRILTDTFKDGNGYELKSW